MKTLADDSFPIGATVRHIRYGDGEVTDNAVRGGWIMVRFGNAAPIKCSQALMQVMEDA